MSVKHETVTLNATAKDLAANVPDGRGKNYAGEVARTMAITNAGTASVFIGGPGVTATNYGFELKTGASMTLDLTPGDIVFAVAATTGSVRVLHTGV